MPARPWYPHNVGDYDRKTKLLTLEQHGAYRALLDYAWDNDGLIPETMRELAQIWRTHPNKARKLWGCLGGYWYAVPGGYRNKRVDKNLSEAADISEERRKAAKKRWDAIAYAKAMQATSTPTEEIQKDSSPPHSPLFPPTLQSRGEESLAEASSASPAAPCQCPHQKLVDLYHEKCPTLPRVKVISERRQQYARQRWREILDGREPEKAIEWFGRFFERVNESRFLTGQIENGERRPFLADFEWILKPNNFIKIYEGKYDG